MDPTTWETKSTEPWKLHIDQEQFNTWESKDSNGSELSRKLRVQKNSKKNKTSAMETLRRDLSDPWWESWNREKFNFGTTQKWVKKSLLRKLCEVPTKVVTSEEWSKQGRTQKEDRKPLQKDQANKSVGRMPWHQEPTKDVISCEKLRGEANILRSADIRMGEPNWANLSYPQMNT